MKIRHYSLLEFGSIRRSEIDPFILRDLQRFDEQHSLRTGDTVFDWNHLHLVKAKSYVGVLQVPGLQIEILPKVETNWDVASDTGITALQTVRENLLFMLSMAGKVPLHERDIASQQLRTLPLWEALIRVFVRRLLEELRRGQQHQYIRREENLTCVRGRILLHKQLSRNAAYRHLIHVEFDEFSNDTPLNRILKAGCVRLLTISNIAQTQQFLREALLELADVEDCMISPHEFDALELDRNSQRFADLLEFCRLVLMGTTISPQKGKRASFSLLFPMEDVFEGFVARCLRRHAEQLGLRRSNIHVQAQSRRRWLLRDNQNSGRFRLKPDVLIDRPDGPSLLILDTKWKRLVSDELDAKNGVDPRDMYQLYAYATRYQCRNNILLFPKVPGATSKSYRIDEEGPAAILQIKFLDLAYDLRRHRSRLIDDLKVILDIA